MSSEKIFEDRRALGDIIVSFYRKRELVPILLSPLTSCAVGPDAYINCISAARRRTFPAAVPRSTTVRRDIGCREIIQILREPPHKDAVIRTIAPIEIAGVACCGCRIFGSSCEVRR